jgi:hypothetical protein
MSPELAKEISEKLPFIELGRISANYWDTGIGNAEIYLFRRDLALGYIKYYWWEQLWFLPGQETLFEYPIIHKASLSKKKKRNFSPPWWDFARFPTLEKRVLDPAYQKLLKIVGEGGRCARASDPESDKAFEKFMKHIGAWK